MTRQIITLLLFALLRHLPASAQCPLTFTAILGICANAPGTVIALPGFTTYEWSSGETTNIINPETMLQIDIDIFAPTTVSLLEVVDANGLCPAIILGDTEIDIDILAAPDIEGELSICANQTSVLTVTPTYDTYF
jgi:hypothetical protein